MHAEHVDHRQRANQSHDCLPSYRSIKECAKHHLRGLCHRKATSQRLLLLACLVRGLGSDQPWPLCWVSDGEHTLLILQQLFQSWYYHYTRSQYSAACAWDRPFRATSGWHLRVLP